MHLEIRTPAGLFDMEVGDISSKKLPLGRASVDLLPYSLCWKEQDLDEEGEHEDVTTLPPHL